MYSEDTLSQEAQARVGSVLRSKWRLDSLLGVGGMAAVYAATHRNGKRGAVKLLHAFLSVSGDARERFLREGYLANRVQHPGVVTVLDDDVTEDGAPFLVMELLDGESVESLLERRGGRISVDEAQALGLQLLDVLEAAHAQGIVHRDLKPQNLFLTSSGQLKVLDFGIARLFEAGASAGATRTGSTLGTPAFMPPEQALGNVREIDGRTDLWATGATLFALVSGRYVHQADTPNKVLLAAMTQPAPPLSSVVPHAPTAFAAVVDRALAFAREQRWPDARSMREALRHAAQRGPLAQAPPGPSTVGVAPHATSAAGILVAPSASAGRSMPALTQSQQPTLSGSFVPRPAGSASPLRTVLVSALAAGVLVVGGALLFVRRPPPESAQRTEEVDRVPEAPATASSPAVTPLAPDPATADTPGTTSAAASSAAASAAASGAQAPSSPKPTTARPPAAPTTKRKPRDHGI